MSIIFDALKKAESSRQRGQVPGLHGSQHGTHLRTGTGSSPRRAIVLACIFALCGAGAWYSWAKRDSAPSQLAEGASSQATSPANSTGTNTNAAANDETQAASGSSISSTASGVEPSMPTIDLTQTAPPPVEGNMDMARSGATQTAIPPLAKPLTGSAEVTPASNQASTEAQAAMANQRAMAEMQAREEAARLDAQAALQAQAEQQAQAQTQAAINAIGSSTAPSSMASPSSAEMTSTPSQAATPGALPAYFELPYSVRHSLPKMNLSMHVYDPTPQRRFVIMNGKRLVEGEQIEGGVTIRSIRSDGLECDFQGTAFFYPRGN